MDALDSLFLNDETETPPPAPAPAGATTTAPRPAAAAPKPTGPEPTPEDNANALNAALAREMARRRWAPSSAVARELEGRRQELEWHQMQSWSRRLLATAGGQQALRGEIQRLEQAHRQAIAREKGLRQYLKSDPISSSLINEEAQIAAKERAERFEEAARATAAREAQAEAQREAALQREREALRQRESEKEDEAPRPKTKSSGAPKPR